MRLSLSALLLSGLVFGHSPVAVAEVPQFGDESRLYTGFLTGLVGADDARGSDKARGGQLLLGRHYGERLSAEVHGSWYTFETDAPGTDFYRLSAGVDALWRLRGFGTTPYLLAGIGLAHNDVYPDSRDQLGVSTHAGAGLLSQPFGPYGVQLRAEIRVGLDWIWDNPRDFYFQAGVVLPLRTRAVRTVEIVRTEVKTVYVEAAPAIPATVDADGDGVPDERDRCPETLADAAVDPSGCVLERAIVSLQGVNFESGSARLTADSADAIAAAAAALLGQPAMRVEVAGHTDDRGGEEYNLDLSRRRASSVVDSLVQAGIARERLMPAGYGESTPLEPNDTPESRRRNRRVEFRVLGAEG